MTTTIDRLSDDVICHVLSFLPTKVSASTSILAKRWRFLWAHVPNLDFNGFDFEGPEIINRAIALHRAETMNTLSFSGNMAGGSPDQVPTWITHAINRGVRNLYIDIEIGYGFTVLPKCLLTSKTLVDVKLHWCIGFPSSGEVFFPSLRKLHLSSIVCDDEESLPHLLSGCPVLQDLIITGCSGQSFVFVYSLTIKRLDVQLDCSCCDRFSSVLNINAPSLEYLSVGNYYLENITVLRVMNSLIEAYLFLFGVPVYIDEEDEEEYDTEVHFLHCLCNAKCLKISIDGVWKLVKIAGLDSTVKFDNLTKLEIDSLFDFHELVKFLEAADNLQLLTFTLCGMHNAYREPKLVPTCMLLCLKTVRIKSGHVLIAKNDFESIRYVLKNGQVLERMEIHHSYPYRDSEKEELEMLERGSESCQLAFLLRI